MKYNLDIKGFGPQASRQPLQAMEFNIKELKPHDVVVKISHCGICYSDIHLIDGDWDFGSFPFIPGHEVVGQVVAKGKKVKGLKKGTRVGVGWFSKVCGKCDSCKSKNENLCASPEMTCVGRNGGFADHVVADDSVIYKIPKKLKSAVAAPLLCAGWTVHGAYRGHQVKKGSQVAVVGIGGLGHLGLQYAKALKFKVSAITSSKDKTKEAKQLGAKKVYTWDELDQCQNKFDFILVTSHGNPNIDKLAGCLKVDGNICFVGVPNENLNFHAFNLIMKRAKVSGNPGGSRKMMKEMLSLAAKHNIKPMIEVFPLAKVNEAIDKIKQNRIRYRAVLKV